MLALLCRCCRTKRTILSSPLPVRSHESNPHDLFYWNLVFGPIRSGSMITLLLTECPSTPSPPQGDQKQVPVFFRILNSKVISGCSLHRHIPWCKQCRTRLPSERQASPQAPVPRAETRPEKCFRRERSNEMFWEEGSTKRFDIFFYEGVRRSSLTKRFRETVQRIQRNGTTKRQDEQVLRKGIPKRHDEVILRNSTRKRYG